MPNIGRRAPETILAVCLMASMGTGTASGKDVIYAFKGKPDAQAPVAGLASIGTTLYGTTGLGGSGSGCGVGCGTVFSVTTKGVENVVYNFQGGTDGYNPVADLIDVSGTLYGTTKDGGASGCSENGCGTVFSVTPSGSEAVLYRFQSGSDGANPGGGLVNVNGTFYGTTIYGGSSNCNEAGCGTVYSISPSGTEKVLYSFQDGADGAYPTGDLINVNGTLYGVTEVGGGTGCEGVGCGTVYSITPSGTETVLYRFQGGTDGATPFGSLINVNGTLYGVTCCGGTAGTVFSFTLGGGEATVYNFQGGLDGNYPTGGLAVLNGVLYGTTDQGGSKHCRVGCGTVYSLTLAGAKSILHAFTGNADGQGPTGGLVDVKGTLYGTTINGGTADVGTVFKIKP